jgi:hypothetical protein
MTVEYEIKNLRILRRFIDKEIGTEYVSDYNRFDLSGYLTVYDLTIEEHHKIREFIRINNLYIKN